MAVIADVKDYKQIFADINYCGHYLLYRLIIIDTNY